jgi:hypothetical protein
VEEGLAELLSLCIKRNDVATKIHQYSVGKENLYFFYRSVILPWELEWANRKFLVSEGNLRKYCQEHDINIKSFESADKLGEAIATEYEAEETRVTGILWFVRQDTKPKDTLRHLRNCFAHGNYKKRQKNRAPCIVIENIDKEKVKAKGFMPLDMLNGLVRAASSCAV